MHACTQAEQKVPEIPCRCGWSKQTTSQDSMTAHFLLKSKDSNFFILTETISNMYNGFGRHLAQTDCETKSAVSLNTTVWHWRPLERSRQLAISHHLHLRAHTHRRAHTREHKYRPTLFGKKSSWSTALQISDELLQSPFSVTSQPQFYLAIPLRQLVLTCRW